jgi:predicted TIM-barrel fold metal-dependent hydrolase
MSCWTSVRSLNHLSRNRKQKGPVQEEWRANKAANQAKRITEQAYVTRCRMVSGQYPDYSDARPFHDALMRANPERLKWGTDWPHPSIPKEIMPDDGHLLDLFCGWTPDEHTRRQILVDTPVRLFGT